MAGGRSRVDGRLERAERRRFQVTPELPRRLAFCRGSVAALHRELVAEAAAAGGGAVPSLATLYRAVERDVSLGLRAGMRGGGIARRNHDVFLERPAGHRNDVWETDHVQVKVEVDIDGRPGRPWVTWFIDCATRVICGFAVTAQVPSRESVLVALRDAISREGEHGPFGGLPGAVRVDRGRDFLSRTVGEALGAFAVPVVDLPAYSPHLKGTVEALNKAVKQMFFAQLPGYTAAPHLKGPLSLRSRHSALNDQPVVAVRVIPNGSELITHWAEVDTAGEIVQEHRARRPCAGQQQTAPPAQVHGPERRL
ncbi:transposase family protein [Streptomyces sp. NPDC086838]|uniref:integrase catalytic domain-containing protein n=1 Tax=Streptomyces sp. NPDC086838 TaxID=3365762 RepID=UPI0037FE4E15